jgi:hypothetical protein
MTREELLSELERILPALRKLHDYRDVLYKELDIIDNPSKSIEDIKADVDSILTVK